MLMCRCCTPWSYFFFSPNYGLLSFFCLSSWSMCSSLLIISVIFFLVVSQFLCMDNWLVLPACSSFLFLYGNLTYFCWHIPKESRTFLNFNLVFQHAFNSYCFGFDWNHNKHFPFLLHNLFMLMETWTKTDTQQIPLSISKMSSHFFNELDISTSFTPFL